MYMIYIYIFFIYTHTQPTISNDNLISLQHPCFKGKDVRSGQPFGSAVRPLCQDGCDLSSPEGEDR